MRLLRRIVAKPVSVTAADTLTIAVLGRYPLCRDHIAGGVEAVIVYLLEELGRVPGLDLHVVTLRPEIKNPFTVAGDRLTVHYLPASRHGGHITNHYLDRHRLLKRLRLIKPRLVHAHIAGEYAEAAHDSGYPYVLTLHGIRYLEARLWKRGLGTGLRTFLVKRSERGCVERARYIISISPYVTQEFHGLIQGKVYEIDNPVPEAFFNVKSPENHNGHLLFVGKACLRKGFIDLLQALALVDGVELHVAGFMETAAGFSSKVNGMLGTNRLSKRVRLLGSLDEMSLLQEYEKSSIFVLPSIQETAPMALLQAMAAGRPSVVSRVGGHPFLIEHGRTGLLVEPADVLGLAAALLGLSLDKRTQKEMGDNARKEALERFHVSTMAEKTLAVYGEILDSPWTKDGVLA